MEENWASSKILSFYLETVFLSVNFFNRILFFPELVKEDKTLSDVLAILVEAWQISKDGFLFSVPPWTWLYAQ